MTETVLPDVPADWTDMLRKLREHKIDGFLAGGALRDLIHGKQPKDVDIFLTHHLFAAKLGPVFGRSVRECRLGYTAPERGLETAVEFQTVDWVYNVIIPAGFVSAEETINEFDFGINRIAYTLDGGWLISPWFWMDSQRRTFTQLRPERLERSRTRWERFSAKYPDFTVVWPKEEPPCSELSEL